jgi:two-component system sensor histidine kinase and response regulator WspE
MSGNDKDYSSLSMNELFQIEAEEQCRLLYSNLLELEKEATNQEIIESLMRAAHSLKGAARIINLTHGVNLAHALEDVFVAGQKGSVLFNSENIDALLKGVDLLKQLGRSPQLPARLLEDFIPTLEKILHQNNKKSAGRTTTEIGEDFVDDSFSQEPVGQQEQTGIPLSSGREQPTEMPPEELSLRIAPEKMSRLLGLASEIQIESRWLPSHSLQLLQLKHRQDELYRIYNQGREILESGNKEIRKNILQDIHKKMLGCRAVLTEQFAELEDHSRRAADITHRLFHEVLNSRMVPLHSGLEGIPRMVRDLGKELGKKAELKVIGRDTSVDRDILQKIEAPLNHLIRNAIDHGIESVEQRRTAGKPETGTITLGAYHQYGMLHIEIKDDGKGIQVEKIRKKVVERNMVSSEIAANFSENELLDFLFLPNFSTKKTANRVSGRGVGLDVVQTAIREARGNVRIRSRKGLGTSFEIQLPLTLSVVRSLLVEIDNEPYAFPVVAIEHVLRVPIDNIKEIEGKPYITYEDRRVGLVSASRLLSGKTVPQHSDPFFVVILADQTEKYGLLVDGFMGIHDLVVQNLDKKVGKIKDVSAAAIMKNGSPVLILDTEDVICSMNKLISEENFSLLDQLVQPGDSLPSLKRILVVDDSITVREVEREMLLSKGYTVEVAIDGQEAWHTLRTGGPFDLVITDIDMPRMNGFELVTMIKDDPANADMPVIIVSYKDREEDRRKGLDAGADYYLTKGSFKDETLAEAVRDLIGDPDSETPVPLFETRS